MYLAPQFDAWVEIFSQLNCPGFEFGSNPMQQPLTPRFRRISFARLLIGDFREFDQPISERVA